MRQADYKVQAHPGPALNKHPRNPRKRDVVVIIAGGPSLTREDVAKVEQADVDIIGINNAYQICNRMEIHYACDTKWWRAHWDKIPNGPARYSLKDDRKKQGDPGMIGVTQLKMGARRGLGIEWPRICWGGNSGYQAINLAFLLGYKKVILLGFDMQETNGETHWHGLHKGMNNPSEQQFRQWRKNYKVLAQELRSVGVTVFNATRQTALECFPKVQIKDVL